MTRAARILLTCAFLLFWPGLCAAFSGKVVAVHDGDTITVLRDREQVRVRLYGIDAPELHQAFGRRAKEELSDLVFGLKVTVREEGKDRYGRVVGIVILRNKLVVNAEMLTRGLAWVYEQYCKEPRCEEWKELQSEAKKARRGLWADSSPTPPWQWRHAKKAR